MTNSRDTIALPENTTLEKTVNLKEEDVGVRGVHTKMKNNW